MRYVSVIILLALAASSVFAQREADPLVALYGNSWDTYSPQGKGVSHYYVNADHTWSGKTRDNRNPGGTWFIKGQEACFHGVGPVSGGQPDECFDILGRKLDEPFIFITEEGTPEASFAVGVIRRGRR